MRPACSPAPTCPPCAPCWTATRSRTASSRPGSRRPAWTRGGSAPSCGDTAAAGWRRPASPGRTWSRSGTRRPRWPRSPTGPAGRAGAAPRSSARRTRSARSGTGWQPYWGPAREVRASQPLLATSTEPLVAGDPAVRRVSLAELDILMPACVAMFTEEVGTSPLGNDNGAAYRARVRDLVLAGRAFARIEDGRVLFKAELGAVSARVRRSRASGSTRRTAAAGSARSAPPRSWPRRCARSRRRSACTSTTSTCRPAGRTSGSGFATSAPSQRPVLSADPAPTQEPILVRRRHRRRSPALPRRRCPARLAAASSARTSPGPTTPARAFLDSWSRGDVAGAAGRTDDAARATGALDALARRSATRQAHARRSAR